MIGKLLGEDFYISKHEFDQRFDQLVPAIDKNKDLCFAKNNTEKELIRVLRIFNRGLLRGWYAPVKFNDKVLSKDEVFLYMHKFSQKIGKSLSSDILYYSKKDCFETNIISLELIRINAYNGIYKNEAGKWEDFQ